MKVTEELLWKYIESDCTDAERLTIEQALATDADLKKEWLERKILHQMMEKPELESPSMRFTKNVMESLPKLSNYAITRKNLRPFFLVVLGSFFTIILCSLFIETPVENAATQQWMSNAEKVSQVFLQDQFLFVGLAMGAVAILLLVDQIAQRRLRIS
ncbi:MAG: hypothetical protein AAF806_28810 [Bacteroidota bacterium]